MTNNEIITNEQVEDVLEETSEIKPLTTNGAVAYDSTTSAVVDLVYLNKRLSKADDIALSKQIVTTLTNMLKDNNTKSKEAWTNKILALSVLLQNYDIKNGNGERTSSLLMAKVLLNDPYIRSIFPAIIPLILKYSGWRNLINLYNETASGKITLFNENTSAQKAINEFNEQVKPTRLDTTLTILAKKEKFVKTHTAKHKFVLSDNPSMLDFRARIAVINEIIKNQVQYVPNNLMYKWMWHTNNNTLGREYGFARFLSDLNAGGLKHYKAKDYRKWLTYYRKNSGLNLLETKLSNKDYVGLDISKLPRRAQRLHLKWFKDHLPDVYNAYMKKLEEDNKLNVSVGVVESFNDFIYAWSDENLRKYAARQFFNSIQTITGAKTFLPIIDLSGSMDSPISRTSSITIANAALAVGLAISIKNKGAFFNKVIPFSSRSNVITFDAFDTTTLDGQVQFLNQALNTLKKYGNYYDNTNLAAAYDEVLNIAKTDPQNAPEGIVILTDGQFDAYHYNTNNSYNVEATDITSAYKKKFKEAKVKMPVVIYWNLRSEGTVQVQNFLNQKGVLGLSGYNPRLLNALYSIDDLHNLTSEQIATTMLEPYFNDILQAISTYDPKAQIAYVQNNLKVFKEEKVEATKKLK